ncbi:MAG: ABC transporter substrate-binding protein [Desulfurococcales archaeon]|nr:ABC transporter substrate-binding protein [Desulfurococcales archaeon]
MVPKKFWESQKIDRVNSNPVGSGPFKFVSRTPGESIVIERDPNYLMGDPKISRIVIRVITETETRYYAIKIG